MSHVITHGQQLGLGRLRMMEPVLDKRQHRFEWQNSPRPDIVMLVGPMLWYSSRLGPVTDELPFPDPAYWWEYPMKMLESGVSGGFHVCGTVRYDGVGQVGVTLQMFRTSDDVYVGEAVTGIGGEYCITSQFNVAHYIVGYLPGTPDKTGATKNTLIATTTRAV